MACGNKGPLYHHFRGPTSVLVEIYWRPRQPPIDDLIGSNHKLAQNCQDSHDGCQGASWCEVYTLLLQPAGSRFCDRLTRPRWEISSAVLPQISGLKYRLGETMTLDWPRGAAVKILSGIGHASQTTAWHSSWLALVGGDVLRTAGIHCLKGLAGLDGWRWGWGDSHPL